jgi:lipase
MQEQRVPVNPVELAVWNREGEGPPLVFVHATGFHARCWDQVIRRLPGRRVIAPDMRGHGRSAKPAPPYDWMSFARDLVGLEIEGAIGIGHSMGGHSVAAAAALRPGMFKALFLIDPTIFRREHYGPPEDWSFIARRRGSWSSPEEMFERFKDRPPFANWDPLVLRDYCDYGVLEDGRLACPPEIEASIYTQANAPDAWFDVSAVQAPVTILRAGHSWVPGVRHLGASPTDPDLALRFPNARDLVLAGRNHYIPMESPELIARLTAQIAETGGFAQI